jgi:hypothetical protein
MLRRSNAKSACEQEASVKNGTDAVLRRRRASDELFVMMEK